MEYNWGIEDLIEAKKKLETLLKKEKNKHKKKYIRQLIESLNIFIEEEAYALDNPSNNDLAEEIPYNKTLANIEFDLISCREYYSLISTFAQTATKLHGEIEEIETILSQRLEPTDGYAKITGATITNERALSLTNEFYKGFSESLYPIFQSAFAERKNSIRFVDSVENECVANSTYIDIIKRYFISIIKTDDLSKLHTFIHEYGHVISYIMNPEAMYYSSEYVFNEVASLFPELVAQYENIGNYDKAHIAFESYLNFVIHRNKAIDLNAHKHLIRLWNKSNREVSDSYIAQVNEQYGYEEESLIEAIETSIDDEGVYVISYMVALELLHIYKQDKKRALEIFENFLKIPPNQSIRAYLESEFSIGSHLEEETKEMLNTLKKELKKSGEFHV